eukprot:CAMPEP_0185204670 /NCGR_PEP_ID=MMETSP1140-20130426/55308_1 /TAXON_ID=298111 /ORGANISM="Pavlova sp., Strain CCMP459" /LENGTH=147 /DNA_ID=CAMNT_0027772235 /DNA_START=30 /DNA_END=472 /DNA_ORIENTATION=-
MTANANGERGEWRRRPGGPQPTVTVGRGGRGAGDPRASDRRSTQADVTCDTHSSHSFPTTVKSPPAALELLGRDAVRPGGSIKDGRKVAKSSENDSPIAPPCVSTKIAAIWTMVFWKFLPPVGPVSKTTEPSDLQGTRASFPVSSFG